MGKPLFSLLGWTGLPVCQPTSNRCEPGGWRRGLYVAPFWRNFGETPAEAALRELAEETGLVAQSCEERAQLLLQNVEDGTVVVSYLFAANQWSEELTASREGQAEWVPIRLLPETDLIDFMQITLPLVLIPGSLLTGTIRHTVIGAPVSYELSYRTMIGGMPTRGSW